MFCVFENRMSLLGFALYRKIIPPKTEIIENSFLYQHLSKEGVLIMSPPGM